MLLASSPAYPHQAFRVGPVAYAVQFHVEVTEAMGEEWATVPAYAEYADRVLGPGGSDRLLAEFRVSSPRMQEHARGVFERWCDLAERRERLVGVQRGVEAVPAGAGARQRLDGPLWESRRKSMPLMPESSRARTTVAVGQAHLGAGRQVEPGLERAVVAERDAEAGVGAQQAALADRDHGRRCRPRACP